MDSVLVVAAHPDDEVLGCGGTLAKLAALGSRIHVAFLADGVSSRPGAPAAGAGMESRREAARKACAILGVQGVSFGDLPDNRLDSLPLLEVTQAVEALVRAHSPGTVFTHHAGDVNIDHQVIHRAVLTACRPQRGHPVRTLLAFEVPSSTEWQLPGTAPAFLPNWFSDISSTLGKKLEALDAYAAELREWPHPRSRQGVEHLARWRGATVGAEAAEAFMLGRHIG
ncbi:MAG: PIG-L deacetylase family protein [Burkholderiaceae bacterium]